MPDLTPAELAAQPGPAALLTAFVALGGEASPAELRMRSGLASSTTSKWLAALRDAGLVDGPKPRPRLTGEGWALAEGGAPATTGGSMQLAEAIARWPAEPQRAFLRLLIAATISRHHLGGPRPRHHPGFIAAGRTGTGKTSMGHFVCQVFGVDATAQIVELGSRTAGEILGRREIDPHEGEWRFDVSPLVGQPLVVFDEFDKADRDQQRAALLLFQGDTRRVIEGTPVELAAVPMLACNTPQDRIPVPVEYRRRSVVLAMDTFADLLDELDLALYELEADGGPPRLALDELRPPASRLPDEVLRLVRELLRRGLTEEGWSLCSLPGVELLALGYAAGAPVDVDLAVLAAAAVRDYLTCAETAGETRPEWRRELAGLRAGPEAIAALEAGQEERSRLEIVRHERAVAQEREALELVGARSQLAEELRQARPDARSLRPEHRAVAKGLRDQLDHLRDDVLASRSEQRLAELRVPADALLASVRELVDRDTRQREADAAIADQQRQARQAARDAERQRKAQQRAQAGAQRRAATEASRQAAAQLNEIRAAAKPLEALWRRTTGAGALDVLRQTHFAGRPLVTYEAVGPEDLGDGRLARFLGAVAAITNQGAWRSTLQPTLSFDGTPTSCEALERWGPHTRSVLEPALRQLQEREDGLQAQAAAKPRKTRPALGPPRTAISAPAPPAQPVRWRVS